MVTNRWDTSINYVFARKTNRFIHELYYAWTLGNSKKRKLILFTYSGKVVYIVEFCLLFAILLKFRKIKTKIPKSENIEVFQKKHIFCMTFLIRIWLYKVSRKKAVSHIIFPENWAYSIALQLCKFNQRLCIFTQWLRHTWHVF